MKCFACGGHVLCVLIKEMSDHEIKRFQHLKFFACGGFIIYVLIKEMSDPGIKWFQPLKFFACGGLKLCVLSIKVVSELRRRLQCRGRIQVGGGAPHLSFYMKLLLSATTYSCKGYCIIDKCNLACYVTEQS